MNDLISRQALCEYALNQKDKSVTPNDIMRFPSAEPEIIHCKDCKYRELDDHYGFMCGLDTGDPYGLGRCADDENWYCADAERRRE